MPKIIICKKCGQKKIHEAFGLCISCYNKQYTTIVRNKKYKINLEYRKSILGKNKEWRKRNKEYLMEYERNKRPNKKQRSEKSKYRQKRWRKTKKGKLANRRHCNKRQRQLGFNIIIPNILDEPMEYHHIDNDNVIPVPKDLHKLFFNTDVEIHRENLKPIIQQLYNIEI